MPIRKLALLVPWVLLVATGVATAQMGTGRITGTITDPQGNAVEGAVISFVDQTGKKLEGTWEREKGKPFSFFDLEGNVLPLAKGQVWIMMLPSLEQATTS